jgi:hypothetical protein
MYHLKDMASAIATGMPMPPSAPSAAAAFSPSSDTRFYTRRGYFRIRRSYLSISEKYVNIYAPGNLSFGCSWRASPPSIPFAAYEAALPADLAERAFATAAKKHIYRYI